MIPIDTIGAAIGAVEDDNPRDDGGRSEVDVPEGIGLVVGVGAGAAGVVVLVDISVKGQPTRIRLMRVLAGLPARAASRDVHIKLVEDLDFAQVQVFIVRLADDERRGAVDGRCVDVGRHDGARQQYGGHNGRNDWLGLHVFRGGNCS